MIEKLAGAFAGLIVGIILLQFGFWGAVFLLLCLGVGWWAGGAIAKEVNLLELFARRPQGGRRRR